MADPPVGPIADGLQRYFFGSRELLARLVAFLAEAAPQVPQVVEEDTARGDGLTLRCTELHADFVALLERSLDERVLELARAAVRDADGECPARGGGGGGGGSGEGEEAPSPWGERQLMRVFRELRRRDGGGGGGSGDDDDDEYENSDGEGKQGFAEGEADDDDPAAGWFPRAMLAASEFEHFMVLLRETARGHAWDMESMFG
jgi:hypothetical protein